MIKRICARCGTVCADDMLINKDDKRRNAVMLVKMQPASPGEFWFDRGGDIFDLCPACMGTLQYWLHNVEFEVTSGGNKHETD